MFITFSSEVGGPALEVSVMTIEILHLAELIHHWLNVRVARHLAVQADKLAR